MSRPEPPTADPVSPSPAAPAPRRPRVLWRLLLFVLCVGGAIAIVTLGWRVTGLPRPRVAGAFQPVPFFAYMAAVSAATLAAVALLLRATEGRSLAALGLAVRLRAVADYAVGSLLGFLPVALTTGLAIVSGYGTMTFAAGSGRWIDTTFLPFLLGTVLISAWEEFIWRGYLLRLFEQGIGRWGAAVATAVLWSAGHLSNDGATPLGLLATAASGVLLAWIVFRTGSLWVALGYHVAWNVTSIHVFGLTTSGMAGDAAWFRTVLRGPAWLAGGAYGFEASLVTGLLDVATLATALLVANRARGGASEAA